MQTSFRDGMLGMKVKDNKVSGEKARTFYKNFKKKVMYM